jgi:AcrR family transcriptional regulator
MSENPSSARVPDRLDARVRRSRDRLGDALVELVQEKPFDAITVQDVLDRAGVARSTFYAHYRDKQDLLLSDADEFFEHMSLALVRAGERSTRLLPVRELFGHVAEMGDFVAALRESGKLEEVLELGRAHFARGIAERLARLLDARSLPERTRSLLSGSLAGALLALLTAWSRSGEREAPERMDEFFHRLAWGGIESAPGS